MTAAPFAPSSWPTAALFLVSNTALLSSSVSLSSAAWAEEAAPADSDASAIDAPASAVPATSEETQEEELASGADAGEELEEDFTPLTAGDLNTVLGVQALAALDKPIVGLDLRFGETWGPRFEASFLWTSRASDAVDGSFVGNQYSVGLEWTPLRTPFVDLHVGAAADIYHLWRIHGDLVEVAASLEANGVLWLTEELGAAVGVRVYPLSTDGLELGKTRSGAAGSPLLLALGVRWRFR